MNNLTEKATGLAKSFYTGKESFSLVEKDAVVLGDALEVIRKAYPYNATEETVHFVEFDIKKHKEEVMKESRYEMRTWRLWGQILREMPNKFCSMDEESKSTLETDYNYLENVDSEEFEDDTAQSALEEIFQIYTNQNHRIYLIMESFEETRDIFPRIKENENEMFFRRLFSFSQKTAIHWNLTILLSSAVRIKEGSVAHNMAGSDIEAAYPPKYLTESE